MFRAGAGAVALGMLLTLTVSLAGCGGGSYQSPPLDRASTYGTWIEEPIDPSTLEGTRVRAPERKTKDLRKLTINRDNTFSMALVDAAGNPVAGATVEGTWDVEVKVIVFEVTQNNLRGNLAGLEPFECSGTGMVDGKGQRLFVTDGDGMDVVFRKAD